MSKRVLCLDDNEGIAYLVADVVEFCGHEPIIETEPMNAITDHIRDNRIQAVLTDLMMPRFTGIDVLIKWKERRSEVRRILITAAPAEQEVRDAVRSGIIQMVISKPPDIAGIHMALLWL